MWSCTTIPKSGGMGALPLSVVHSDDMLRVSATLIGNPIPLSACKLVEQFTERVDHSKSDKKHYDPEHMIHMLLKVGYSLRSFPRLPHNGLEEKNNRNCCQNYPYQLIHRDPIRNVEEALVDRGAWHKAVDLDDVGALDLDRSAVADLSLMAPFTLSAAARSDLHGCGEQFTRSPV